VVIRAGQTIITGKGEIDAAGFWIAKVHGTDFAIRAINVFGSASEGQ